MKLWVVRSEDIIVGVWSSLQEAQAAYEAHKSAKTNYRVLEWELVSADEYQAIVFDIHSPNETFDIEVFIRGCTLNAITPEYL